MFNSSKHSQIAGALIIVSRNPDRLPDNDHTLYHRPNVVIDGVRLEDVCPLHELLSGLHEEGIPTEEIDRMKKELEDTGQTIIHSNLVTAETVQKIVFGVRE